MSIRKRLYAFQAACNKKLSSFLMTAKLEQNIPVMFSLFVVASLYGFAHAAGPGHGKSIVVGFFLNRRSRLRDAVKLALVVSVTHTLGAFVFAGLFQTFLSHVKGIRRMQVQGWITFSIALFIISLGFFMLFKRIFRKNNDQKEEDREDAQAVEFVSDRKSLFAIGILAGMVPCPLSITILLLSIANNAALLGIVAVGGIVLGMFTLLTVVGLVVIKTKSGLKTTGPRAHIYNRIRYGLEIAGALMMILGGAALAFLYLPVV